MADRKPNAGQWVKGQTGNPNGRPKVPDDLKKVPLLTSKRFAATVAKYAEMDEDELTRILNAEDTIVLDKIVCKILRMALVAGDQQRLNFLLDRTVGKVKEVKEIQVMPSPFIVHRPNGEQIEMGAQQAIVDEITDTETEGET